MTPNIFSPSSPTFNEFSPPIYNDPLLNFDDINRFFNFGYVIKKKVYTTDEVRAMSYKIKSCEDNIRIHLTRIPDQNEMQVAYIEGSQVVFKKSKEKPLSITRIVGCGSMEPYFLNVLRSDKVLGAFFDLLKCEKIEHLICQLHLKHPHDGATFPKHIDKDNRIKFDPNWKENGKNISYAVGIIAIDSMSAENGGLFIDENSFPKNDYTVKERPLALTLEPGDMLFLHPEIVHWSEENTSSNSRRTLLTGFCNYGANSKNYPGNCSNDIIEKQAGKYKIFDAPWKKMNDQGFKI